MYAIIRAQLYRDQNEITLAIVNYSLAVKCDETDYEAFYQRAQMYEKVKVIWEKMKVVWERYKSVGLMT